MAVRILTVEDDERIRAAVRLALEDEGWEVDESPNGEEALAAFRRAPADVVLVDIMLPGMSGFDLCRNLRRFSDVPIVVVTHGEQGADVWCAGDAAPVRVPARRIPRLADTVGAGDMFTALFAAALDAGEEPVPAAERASAGVAEILALRA